VGTFFQVFVPRTLDITPTTRTRATYTAHLTILHAVQYHLVYPTCRDRCVYFGGAWAEIYYDF